MTALTISEQDAVLEDSTEGPDVYDIDVIAWDYGLSPLHLAILNGHLEIIDLLVSEYGADALLPVKLVQPGTSTPRGAIMTILLAMALPSEKAKKVVKLLLELGATSAQGDMNHVTAFHYVVSQGNSDILDVLLTNDRPAALSVLNNIGSDGSRYSPVINSPLTTAIDKGHKDMASKLLALGSKTTVDFDDWVKNYLATNQRAKNEDSETTRSRYLDSVVQPIILAAGKGMGQTVEDLLAHGADPHTLEKTAYTVLKVPKSGTYNTAESLLDIIQKKLKTLREYKDPDQNRKEPEKLRDESFYTSGYEEGTYQYWTVLKNFQAAKESNKKAWDEYNKKMEDKSGEGVKEKREAIAKLVRELEKAEKALIDAGAKTFAEMHPEMPTPHYRHNYRYTAPEPSPYETSLKFMTPDLNDAKHQGYVSLFEAAWSNDLEKIKSLTLAPWASPPLPLQTPLKVAIQDGSGFSPFSIAVLRGHYELAKKIVEICIIQYHKDDGLSTRQRWNMRTEDSDDESSDYDSDDDREHKHEHLPIFSELVSDKFTVDNLGEVSNIVKSDVLPLTMIEWPCMPQRLQNSTKGNLSCQWTLLGHAVETDNMPLFNFIMQLGAEQQALLAEEEDDQKCYTVNRSVFHKAIYLGRTIMLAEMIKSTGVGIPLNELIEKSGIEVKTKPKYYQGLSVGGKKRADWAKAPGGSNHVVEEKIPPLLQSAHLGSVDSVDWFMSDAPMRRYKEFAENNKSDKRIKSLEQSGKGFDKTIGMWLNSKSTFPKSLTSQTELTIGRRTGSSQRNSLRFSERGT
jgi:ankyrin repeat protein